MEARAPEQEELTSSRAPAFLWLAALAMAAAAAAITSVLASEQTALPEAPGGMWALLAAAFLAAELCVFDFTFRGESQSFAINEIALVIGLFFFSPPLVVAAILAGSAVAMLLQRTTPLKFVYNLGQQALGAASAALVFHALTGSNDAVGVRTWLAALLGALASSGVAWVMISVAILAFERRIPLRAFLRSSAFSVAGGVVNTTLGLMCVVVLYHEPIAIALLLAPVVVVIAAYRAYLSEQRKSEGLQFLYGASQALQSARGLDAGLLALLGFARETLHAELAEIVVFAEDDTATAFVTTVGPRDAQTGMTGVDRAEVEPLLAPVQDSDHAVLVGAKNRDQIPARPGFEIGSAILAPLPRESGIRGAVLIANGKGNVRVFKQDELRLVETFASHLGVTLEKSQLNASLTQLRALKNELAHQAYHDSLTGLANRALFHERVAAGLAGVAEHGTGLAVLFIDLDDFKTVNDTMGHAAGDALLRVVGERINSCVGPEDTAARLGGDEFAVLLTNATDESDIAVIADRILVALGDPTEIDGQLVVANASIGAATHASAEDPDALMQNADIAMYTAKRNGKGRCDFFEPTLNLSLAHRRQLKLGLAQAVDADEFVLHYQPVVTVATGAIVAVEALVRWRDPARGLLPPSEFIGIAEETGLIMPIGRFVLREACRQAKEWETLAPNMRFFVNISARQLADPELIEHVADALNASQLDPSRLILEITEAATTRDVASVRDALIALKALGVGLGLDDASPWYSSLHHLRQLPIDTLKVAKPFVDAMDETAEDAALVQDVVNRAHVLGIQVVAEGVERAEQSASLIDMRCDWAQGYYYARSLEPGAMTTLLRRTAKDDSVPSVSG